MREAHVTYPVVALPSAFGSCIVACIGGFHRRNESGISVANGDGVTAIALLVLLSPLPSVDAAIASVSITVLSLVLPLLILLSALCTGKIEVTGVSGAPDDTAAVAANDTGAIVSNAFLICSCCSRSLRFERARDTSCASTSMPSRYAGSIFFAAHHIIHTRPPLSVRHTCSHKLNPHSGTRCPVSTQTHRWRS